MFVSEIKLQGVRSFEHAEVHLAKRINVFTGWNNSGKSTLLKAVLGLQYYPPFEVTTDLRQPLVAPRPLVDVVLDGDLGTSALANVTMPIRVMWDGVRVVGLTSQNTVHFGSNAIFAPLAPTNGIYPYLSRRKAVAYHENVGSAESLAVRPHLDNLFAKLDYVSTSERPAFLPFMRACEDILGLRVSAVAAPNGKRAAYIVDDFRNIPITAMGEGVANVLGLLADLFIADKKIFLIEEIENDIHPAALKKLLRLIAENANKNQFLISTHSNIVVRYLCAEPESKLFSVSMKLKDRIPTSTVEEVPSESSARRAVIEELGYDFADFDLHAAWLFLEESSAEKIIRDFLVPTFIPNLAGRLRTFATSGVDNVEPKLNDFDRLFVFLNLESAYKNRAWVIVDAGEHETKVVQELRDKWAPKGWNDSHFQQFVEHDFERYFPVRFKEEIDAACGEPDKRKKRALKVELLNRVVAWIAEDQSIAKTEFSESAKEVIDRLQDIARSVMQ